MAYVGFKCKTCGENVIMQLDLDSESTLVKYHCSCQSCHLGVEKINEESFRFMLPCYVCSKNHIYKISKDVLLNKEIISFPCQSTALEVLFIGKQLETVEYFLKSLDALESENGEVKQEMDDIYSPYFYDALNYIGSYITDGDVKCSNECKNQKEDFTIFYKHFEDYDNITLKCKNCGKEKIFKVKDENDLNEILINNEIII